jgi:hypothetical protein
MAKKRFTSKSVKDAYKWFGKKVKSLFKKDKDDATRRAKSQNIKDYADLEGKMHFFNMYTMGYPDPKYKDTLKYYDIVPLYFPIDMTGSSHGSGRKIRALNIHYLPPKARVQFMDEMKSVIIDGMDRLGYNPDEEGYNKVAYANLTKWVGKYADQVYQGLAGVGDARMLRMCYRSYLVDRIATQITKIKLSEWENVVNLIDPKFYHQDTQISESKVYADIRSSFAKYKGNNWGSIR